MTRTQLSRHFGVTVPAIKKILTNAGILSEDGKEPLISAYLQHMVVWKMMPDDSGERFFMLKRLPVEEAVPELASQAGDNRAINVRNKYTAGDLLAAAGSSFRDAMSDADLKICPFGNEDIGWLAHRAAMSTLLAESKEDEIAFAEKLDEMRPRLEALITSGKISQGDDVRRGIASLIAVADWYRTRGQKAKPKKPVSIKCSLPPLPEVLVYSDDVRQQLANGNVRAIPLTADEQAMLEHGYTVTAQSTVTAPLAKALRSACDDADIDTYPAVDDVDFFSCNWFRISTDRKFLLASVIDENLDSPESFWWYQFAVEFSDGMLLVGLRTKDQNAEDEASNLADDFYGPSSVKDLGVPKFVTIAPQPSDTGISGNLS